MGDSREAGMRKGTSEELDMFAEPIPRNDNLFESALLSWVAYSPGSNHGREIDREGIRSTEMLWAIPCLVDYQRPIFVGEPK